MRKTWAKKAKKSQKNKIVLHAGTFHQLNIFKEGARTFGTGENPDNETDDYKIPWKKGRTTGKTTTT